MYFSDILRIKICKKFNINLENYVWDTNLNNNIMEIKLSYFETLIHDMKTVYKYGFNIGYCNLTSRYFAISFPTAKIVYGTLPLIQGTKNSNNGNHAWIIKEGYYIDPTLRLKLPEEKAIEIGYTIDKIIEYNSSRILSEYNLYSHCIKEREKNITKFNNDLISID